jgi:hypothetical protein
MGQSLQPKVLWLLEVVGAVGGRAELLASQRAYSVLPWRAPQLTGVWRCASQANAFESNQFLGAALRVDDAAAAEKPAKVFFARSRWNYWGVASAVTDHAGVPGGGRFQSRAG